MCVWIEIGVTLADVSDRERITREVCMYVYIFMYVCMYVCVCVCVCV